MKEKGKVVDMFSRVDMNDHGQDTEANDAQAHKLGRFLGAMSLDESYVLRTNTASLRARSEQLTAMHMKWDGDFELHIQHLYRKLTSMGIDTRTIDLTKQDVMIDENGKVWLVDLPNSADNSGMVH